MPKFAANLTMMFNEVPFLDRADEALAAGFKFAEFLFPYAEAPSALAEVLSAGPAPVLVLFNFPPGDWAGGERGLACLSGREADFNESLATAGAYASALTPRAMHLMAGNGDRRDAATRQRYREAVKRAADWAAERGIKLLIEPLNSRDMPGYFLNDFDFAADFIADLGHPNLALQFDIYHCQIIHGDVTRRLREALPIVGHIQIASVPSRNEPGCEELNAAFLFEMLDREGYTGVIGCEYRPKAGTLEGLGWFEPWKASQSW